MKNLYIAGSLFNEAEVNQRIKEGNQKLYESSIEENEEILWEN